MNNPVDDLNINYYVFLINHHVSKKNKQGSDWLRQVSFGVNETSSGNNMIFGLSPTNLTDAKQTTVTSWDFGDRKTVLLTISAAGRYPRDGSVYPWDLHVDLTN